MPCPSPVDPSLTTAKTPCFPLYLALVISAAVLHERLQHSYCKPLKIHLDMQPSERRSKNDLGGILPQSLPSNTEHPPEQVIDRFTSLSIHCYEWPEPVLLCTRCCVATKANTNRVSRHLGEKHNVPRKRCRGLNMLVRSLGLSDPAKLHLRLDGSEPHPHLVLQRSPSPGTTGCSKLLQLN